MLEGYILMNNLIWVIRCIEICINQVGQKVSFGLVIFSWSLVVKVATISSHGLHERRDKFEVKGLSIY